ncbi:MAG: hypothetical protein ACREBS_07515 [Nitrososphaerales archaeon]
MLSVASAEEAGLVTEMRQLGNPLQDLFDGKAIFEEEQQVQWIAERF